MTAHSANLVERHFHETAPYWKDVYGQDTLNGALYRVRRAGVLRYVDELNLAPGTRVLEVGCGAGSTSLALAERGFSVNAVDAVLEMVKITAEAAREQGVGERIHAAVGDVYRLDFPDHTFDLAAAIGVMEWMPSLREPLGELYRVLKPGGHLIVNVDNAWALHCVLDPRMSPAVASLKKMMRRIAVQAGLAKPLARPSRCTREKFDRTLQAAGFAKLHSHTSGFGPYTLLGAKVIGDPLGVRIHHRLQSLADRDRPVIRHGGETYLVLARKPQTEASA